LFLIAKAIIDQTIIFNINCSKFSGSEKVSLWYKLRAKLTCCLLVWFVWITKTKWL